MNINKEMEGTGSAMRRTTPPNLHFGWSANQQKDYKIILFKNQIMEMILVGAIFLVIFRIFRDPNEEGFLLIKRFGMLYGGVLLIVSAIAIELLEIGSWFLAISIPGSLLFTIWYYFEEKKNTE